VIARWLDQHYRDAEHCELDRFVSDEDEAKLMGCKSIWILMIIDGFLVQMLRKKSHCVDGSPVGRKIAQPQKHDFSVKLQNFATSTEISN